VKTIRKSLKIWQKWRPMSFYLAKWRFFWRSGKNGLNDKIFAQKMAQKFFWQVSEIRAKILCNTQHFACSYTYGCKVIGRKSWKWNL